MTCSHCGLALRGYGSVDSAPLCHPEVGMDCYRLVSVYRHPTPCTIPYCVSSAGLRSNRDAEMNDGTTTL